MTGSNTRRTDVEVDVVVPVYNAVDDLERCVESVLAHTDCRYRLVLIDDASPDPAVASYFAALAQRALPQVVLLRNRRNRGFPRTANRGMLLSRADVVLLNSDTVVTRGWLSALARCAASSATIGTVTPFSNNAEICSFPRFCVNNAPGVGDEPEAVRSALARAAVPTYPQLPTGVGFCFYIRRELIDAIGVFDPAFGPGYGEENDFCMRALSAGYRSVLCDDAYVLHVGGRSFEGQKPELGTRNLALLLERHPRYAKIVEAFIAGDPLRPLRDAALAQLRVQASPARGVLHVTQSHGGGGGTGRHVRTLVAAAGERYRHYIATAVGDDWRIEEPLPDGAHARIRFPAAARGVVAGVRRRNRGDVRNRPHPPAQHRAVPRRSDRRGRGARPSLRIHGARFLLCVPDDHVARAGRDVLRRRDRRGGVHTLPRRAAAVSRARHRGLARAAPRASREERVPHRAIAMGCVDDRAVLSGAADRSDPPWRGARFAGSGCRGTPGAAPRSIFPTTACPWSLSLAPSVPTRDRAGSIGWSSAYDATASAYDSC